MKGFRAVKETGRVETQEGEKGKVEDRVPKREKRIYKELEGLCLCGLDKLHSRLFPEKSPKNILLSHQFLFLKQTPTLRFLIPDSIAFMVLVLAPVPGLLKALGLIPLKAQMLVASVYLDSILRSSQA